MKILLVVLRRRPEACNGLRVLSVCLATGQQTYQARRKGEAWHPKQHAWPPTQQAFSFENSGFSA